MFLSTSRVVRSHGVASRGSGSVRTRSSEIGRKDSRESRDEIGRMRLYEMVSSPRRPPCPAGLVLVVTGVSSLKYYKLVSNQKITSGGTPEIDSIYYL